MLDSGMTSRRNLFKLAGLGAAAVGAGGLLAACGDDKAVGGTTVTAPNALAKSTPFRIASAPVDNYFIDAVNQAQHHFAKYNLEVPKFLYPSSGVQSMQMLAAGAVDGLMQDCLLTMASFVNSEKGKRPVIIGMRIPETTYSIVVNKGTWPDAGAGFEERMASLRGKRIGVTAVGAGTDQQLRLALEAAGMKYEDVTHLGVGQLAPGIAQMNAGRIDAYVGFTFMASRLMAAQTGGKVLIDFNGAGVPEIISRQEVDPIVVREDFARDHADVAKAWLAAQWDGKDWILNNREAAAKLLNDGNFAGKALEISAAYIEHFANNVVPKLKPMWKVPRESIETMAKVAEKLGIAKPGTLPYEELVPEFARFA